VEFSEHHERTGPSLSSTDSYYFETFSVSALQKQEESAMFLIEYVFKHSFLYLFTPKLTLGKARVEHKET
jgi:hypothetical protein